MKNPFCGENYSNASQVQPPTEEYVTSDAPQYQRAESPLPTANNQKNTNTQNHTTLNYVVALHLKCWGTCGEGGVPT